MENGNPIDPTSRTKSDFRALFFGKTRLFLREQPNAKKASIITGAILGGTGKYAGATGEFHRERLLAPNFAAAETFRITFPGLVLPDYYPQ